MDLKFTTKQKRVIEYLHQEKVTTNYDVIQKLDVSTRTIIRALNKYGYYSSYNYNACYYTLRDIPRFNNYGLWTYNDIRFSKYNSITATIVAIIDKSPAGYTNTEMSQRLGTETKNLLSRLCGKKRLAKFYIGHQAVYLSTEPTQQTTQKQSRKQEKVPQLIQKQQTHLNEAVLPEGIDVKVIIRVLINMIKQPDASVASITMTLQAQQLKVSVKEVGQIISFYGLEKKTVR